jgi:hypothetical protein
MWTATDFLFFSVTCGIIVIISPQSVSNASAAIAPSRICLQKLVVAHMLNDFPTFYRARMLIVVFKRSRHWTLSWISSVQFKISHLFSSGSILISFSHHLRLGLTNGLFPSGFLTKMLYEFLINISSFLVPYFLLSLALHLLLPLSLLIYFFSFVPNVQIVGMRSTLYWEGLNGSYVLFVYLRSNYRRALAWTEPLWTFALVIF